MLPNQENAKLPGVIILGTGLIGSSVINSLSRTGLLSLLSFNLNWSAPETFNDVFKTGFTHVMQHHLTEIVVIWAAGKAGFLSTDSETEAEMSSFKAVMSILRNLKNEIRTSFSAFIISSAGALYEGQKLVTKGSEPSPSRPYGELKQDQENLFLSMDGIDHKHIIRASSVYGLAPRNMRQGLVSTLVRNLKKHKETAIYGHMSTLRDYIWAEDVGRWIAKEILNNPPQHKRSIRTSILASGKPTSIHEVITILEALTHRKLLLRFEKTASNAAHITYSPAVVPDNWKPTPLMTGLRSLIGSSAGYQHV